MGADMQAIVSDYVISEDGGFSDLHAKTSLISQVHHDDNTVESSGALCLS